MQRQRAVLQHPRHPAQLCAADQFAAGRGDFVRAGRLEAHRVRPVRLRQRLLRGRVRLDAEQLEPGHKSLTQPTVAPEDATGKERMGDGRGDRVGQLIGMQDGTPTGRTTDAVPTQCLQPAWIGLLDGLGVSEGEASRVPTIEAEGRWLAQRRDRFEQSLVKRHVLGAGEGRRLDQAPAIQVHESIIKVRGTRWAGPSRRPCLPIPGPRCVPRGRLRRSHLVQPCQDRSSCRSPRSPLHGFPSDDASAG